MLWSRGWSLLVLGGKNCNLMFSKGGEKSVGCAEQRCNSKRTLLLSGIEPQPWRNETRTSDVTHTFKVLLQSRGSDLTFLKQWGFFDLPRTRAGCFSLPLALQDRKTVTLSLLTFPPLHFSPCGLYVSLGICLKNTAVSSQLKTSCSIPF